MAGDRRNARHSRCPCRPSPLPLPTMPTLAPLLRRCVSLLLLPPSLCSASPIGRTRLAIQVPTGVFHGSIPKPAKGPLLLLKTVTQASGGSAWVPGAAMGWARGPIRNPGPPGVS